MSNMIERELSELLESYPKRVNWTDIVDFANFDERLSAIDCIIVNIIGVSEGFIEFIPDNEPPLREEVFCWIWAIRPDFSKAIINLDMNEEFKILLNYYIDNNVKEFWNHIINPE